MARLTRDSDSEPDLAAHIHKNGRSAETRATRGNPPLPRTVKNQEVVKSTVRLRNTTLNASPEGFQHSRRELENTYTKPRRRVLNKSCDNSLLRAFDPLKESRPPSSDSKSPKTLSQVLKMTPENHRKHRINVDSCVSLESEGENEVSADDFTGLSDFIVNDSSILEEDDSAEEYARVCPPQSTRKLVKGRRPQVVESEGESRFANHSQFQENEIVPPLPSKPTSQKGEVKDILNTLKKSNVREGEASQSRDQTIGTDTNERTASISFPSSGREPPGPVPINICFATPPTSPQKTQKSLLSPKKYPRIPSTSHRPSTDAFWDPYVISEWDEERSPRKNPKPRSRTNDDSFEANPATALNKGSHLTQDRQAYEIKKAFTQKKHEIAEAFLRELDKSVTDGKVSEMAASTGGIKIIWSKRLKTTAGRANWKREAMRTLTIGREPEPKVTFRHHASIELAEKVIDDEQRLLNVIAHEFCHLANFMISGIKNNPHGKEFKSWAMKCSQQFENRGIRVTTKHSYDIDYKYTWECTNCGSIFKRHSKSIDPLRHRCGSCKSRLVQIKPMPRAIAATNEYHLFVRENMKKVIEQNPGSPQKQILTLMGRLYQEHKASKFGSAGEKAGGERVEHVSDGSAELMPNDNQVGRVIRKLNFLDLTDP